MSTEKPNCDYNRWPDDSEARKNLARDLFGARLIAERDGNINAVYRLLFKNERLKLPSPEIAEAYEWIEQIDDRQRQILLNLIADRIDLAYYGLMCDFDGVGGNLMHEGYAELLKLKVDIVRREENGWIVEEAIEESFDLKDPRQFFYNYWHDWKERFSTASDLVHVVEPQSVDETL